MRPSLLAIVVVLAIVVPACANGSGRGRSDTHVGSPDTGPRIDAALPMNDGGTAIPDMGTGAPDTGGSLPDTGGSLPDMGGIVLVDAYAPDTGGPAPDTGCASAAACSDGIGCNGVERCESGACVPGTPVTCDDGLSCTTDSCVEPGMCAYTSTCAGGAACGPTGCASSCAESPCRLLSPQCGCPTGQACYPTGTTRACAAAGSGTAGAACTNNSSCSATNMCLNVSTGTTAVNVCTHMCTTDGECGGGLCILQLDDGTGAPVTGFSLCTHTCNAITQTGCPTGSECEIFQESTGAMRAFTDCTAPVGTGGNGASCVDDTGCRAGYLCIDPTGGTSPTCHKWCGYPSSTGCPGGQTCYEFTTPIVINSIDYGVCA